MGELYLIDNAGSKGRDEWGKIFDDAGLIWGPVMGYTVPQDQHAQELFMFRPLAIRNWATTPQ